MKKFILKLSYAIALSASVLFTSSIALAAFNALQISGGAGGSGAITINPWILTASTTVQNTITSLNMAGAGTSGTNTPVWGVVQVQPTALTFSASSTITDGASLLISPAQSGVKATTTNIYGLDILTGSVLSSGGIGVTNGYGLSVSAPTGANSNYAAIFNGIVGIGSTTPATTTGQVLAVQGNVGISGTLTVANIVATGTCTGAGCGSTFPFTPTANGNATSTTIILNNGLISTASSTFSANLSVSGPLSASSTLTVAGNSVLSGFLSTASSTFSSTLFASGLSSFNGGFVAASSSVMGDFRVTGVATSTNEAILGDINNTSNSTVNPYLRGSSGTLSISTAGNAGRILSVQNNYAYLTSNGNTDTLQVFDLSTSSPALMGQLASVLGGNAATALFVQGRYLYNVGNGGAFSIVDIAKPQAPVRKSFNILTSGNLTSIYVSGRYAYMVDSTGANENLYIWDVSDPVNPVQVSTLANGGASGSYGRSVFVTGKFAYVTADAGRLRKIDISNPVAPAETGFASTTGSNLTSIYVQDNYAYVPTFSNGGLEIYDISTSSPAQVGRLTGINSPIAVYVYGKYAYVVNEGGTTKLRIIDVSNPTSPTVLGSVTANTSPEDVQVNGKYAYVVSSNSTLQTYQIPGLEATAANIYSLSGGDAQFRNSLFVGNEATVGNSLSVGIGGIFSAGPLSVPVSSTTQLFPVSAYFGGAVGVASTSPSSELVVGVTGTTAGTTTIYMSSTATGNGTCIQMRSPNNTQYALYIANGGTVTAFAGSCK